MKKYAKNLEKYCRLTNYISATQIYLKDNFFLEGELKPEHIKPRLLGHWGTCPGINLVYGATNVAIKKYENYDFLYIVGPGHGFPAYQAGTFLDGSLSKFYQADLPYTKAGLARLVKNFSVPYGFPSHINPEAPGAILEGGELGYSLSTAYGAVLENEKLIAVTLIGDGEAETGPLSGAWQLNRFLNLEKDGAVLPVLHLNGYKISGPTIFSTFSDEELKKYFESLHYEPIILDYENGQIYENLLDAFDLAISKIDSYKKVLKSGTQVLPDFPLIILKTPKGLSAPDEFEGVKIVGNSASHQTVFKNPRENEKELKALEQWLLSYKIDELLSFDKNENILLDKDIKELLPSVERSLGANIYARRGAQNIKLPDIKELQEDPEKLWHISDKDTMRKTGIYFKEIYKENSSNFFVFSPDETYSNHIDAIFDETQRRFVWPIKDWEKDLSKSGRVIEILSEHELFGMLQGYTLTGRHGFFVTYESFAQIVSSMLDQYIKFIKVARKVPWREPVSSLNIILTSLLERQDHNGFSHQNAGFIANILDKSEELVNVYYPADSNIMLASLDLALKDRNVVNVFVAGKRNKNIFLNMDSAKAHVSAGASIWEDFSDEEPDIVIATAGDYITRETLKAIELARDIFPNIKFRFVNFNQLDILESESTANIEFLLTADKPVLFNYHGRPNTIKKLFFDLIDRKRIIINGYTNTGSTTTPFDLLSRNGLSRYDSVKDMANLLARFGKISLSEADEIHFEMNKKIAQAREFAKENFIDLPDLQFPE